MPKAKRTAANIILWPVLLAGLSGVGYVTYQSSQAEAELELITAELRTVSELRQRWQDAARLLEQTPRIALAPQISGAQELSREISGLQLRTCAADVARADAAHVRAQIEVMLAFMGQASDSLMRDRRTQAALARVDSQRALSLCDPQATPMSDQVYRDLRKLEGAQ